MVNSLTCPSMIKKRFNFRFRSIKYSCAHRQKQTPINDPTSLSQQGGVCRRNRPNVRKSQPVFKTMQLLNLNLNRKKTIPRFTYINIHYAFRKPLHNYRIPIAKFLIYMFITHKLLTHNLWLWQKFHNWEKC